MNVTTALRVPAAVAALTLLLFPLAKSSDARAEEMPERKKRKAQSSRHCSARSSWAFPGRTWRWSRWSTPGGASLPHRHDANVLVYVLEGSVIMQVQGQAPVTLKAGDTFFETPTDIHLQSANASKTEPAKFIAIVIKDKGAPVSRPVAPAQHPTHAPRS